jgi:hypothetical protein
VASQAIDATSSTRPRLLHPAESHPLHQVTQAVLPNRTRIQRQHCGHGLTLQAQHASLLIITKNMTTKLKFRRMKREFVHM